MNETPMESKQSSKEALTKRQLYRQLFISCFTLSAFTFGGGYVIVSLMRSKFVEDLGWLSEDEMLNITAIAQSAPGPVAINTSILLGYEVAGVPGAAIAIFGTVLPPFIIISIISFFYDAFRTNPIVNNVLNGMQAGVAAVIMDVVLGLGHNVIKTRDWINIALMFVALHPEHAQDVGVGGVLGAVRSILRSRKERAA